MKGERDGQINTKCSGVSPVKPRWWLCALHNFQLPCIFEIFNKLLGENRVREYKKSFFF